MLVHLPRYRYRDIVYRYRYSFTYSIPVPVQFHLVSVGASSNSGYSKYLCQPFTRASLSVMSAAWRVGRCVRACDRFIGRGQLTKHSDKNLLSAVAKKVQISLHDFRLCDANRATQVARPRPPLLDIRSGWPAYRIAGHL